MLLALCVLTATVLPGCSFGKNILDVAKDKYDLDDTVKSSVQREDETYIFKPDQTIDQVSQTLSKEIKPERTSDTVDGKKVLVYDDYIVTLTKDDNNKTNLEVATYGFVRDNYHPSFFEGLLAYSLLSNILGADDWARRQGQRCRSAIGGSCYNGYAASGGHYKGPGSKPLFKSSPFRGGGLGAGK
ncbi:DUF4247 domain-containing protein [Tuberibacillus sp. Marseille-P3662]|uniref:DUF4247 domain-containing protein n=1 Tax=Tuberibacillus sp. Marseille-P3662 TaxID=1965358 RepID=UPI0020CAB346|nr:DUF4247 domain-containing protein [Tuberibacillus sp. Marseille-P3662]